MLISLEDYDSLTETAYLLRSPTNARCLLASLAELEKGKGKEREARSMKIVFSQPGVGRLPPLAANRPQGPQVDQRPHPRNRPHAL